MRVYLDTCCLQRPLDSRTHIRIALEAEAVLGILALCESGEVELVSSDVLAFEVSRTPDPARQEFALQALATVKVFVPLNDRLEERARELSRSGIGALDALHLASAEGADADYFCTCDDRLLRKARGAPSPKVKAVSPLDLIQEIEYGSRGKTTS